MSKENFAASWLIELLAWWEGRVQPSQLTEYWNCSRQSASKKLKDFNQAYPAALVYQKSDKSYHPTPSFSPRHISQHANEYLNWLLGYTPPANNKLATLELQPPQRNISPQFMRPIVQALREQRRLDVDYGSVTSADGEGRIIVPHHLVKTHNRWHLRAWCERNSDYRDFVLSRFNGTPELMDKSSKDGSDDTSWHTEVEVIFAPDPRLSAEKFAVIEQDYAMHNGQLRLNTKACMVNYLLQSLNLDPHKIESAAEAQQLVIVNLGDIKKWLFG